MSATAWAAAIVILIGVAVLVLILHADLTYPRSDLPIVQSARTLDPHPPQRRWDDTVYVVPYTHAAPGRPPTIPQAHAIMQQHVDCRSADCARKREARRVLVEAGRMRPRAR
ncbi:hypothetical protein [Nocardia sp. BMG51109]|uniref:hypothetical protein n=1 Tax=Nocardia sp. BMG51109 TaxID=1056816 RepID=UPI0004B84827|nr:hypothetical protein [Nocardia sp. BMG51109]